MRAPRAAWLIAAMGIALGGLAGCGGPYLLRAAYEEARILWRREPIEQVLARDGLDRDTREKLLIVLAARAFARDALGFDVGGSYASISEVDGDAVVHVVSAAYRDRLEAYVWSYPIVGRVPYRGFFDPARARSYAESLETEGLDTAVWPSVAFSTLGWFDDPVLSTMLETDPVALATVVFHELMHAQLYVRGAARFNESLANFAGHRAAIAFFCSGWTDGDPSHTEEQCRSAEDRWADERVYGAVLAEADAALRAMYETVPPAELRSVRREEILAGATRAMSRLGLRTRRYEDLDLSEFNNAVLLQQTLYRSHLQLFEALWEQRDRDLRRTLEEIGEAVGTDADPFAAVQERLRHAQPGDARSAADGGTLLGSDVPEPLMPGILPARGRYSTIQLVDDQASATVCCRQDARASGAMVAPARSGRRLWPASVRQRSAVHRPT